MNETIAGIHPTAWNMQNNFGQVREDFMSQYYSLLVEASSTDPEKKAKHEEIFQGKDVTIHDAIDFCMVDTHENLADIEPEEEDGVCTYFDQEEGEDEDGEDKEVEEEDEDDETTLEHVSKKVKVGEE
jgi:hypothetical protein